MSDTVIRLGGSNIGASRSISNLSGYLNGKSGNKCIVVSAVPDLLSYINLSLKEVLHVPADAGQLRNETEGFYRRLLDNELSAGYKELTGQLVNLLRGIALIGDYSPALKDQVLSFAEKLSAEILWKQLEINGVESKILWPEEIELRTTSDFGNATFLSVNPDFFDRNKNSICIIPGSYGINKEGKIARAGKTAADYTAAVLTLYLGAEKLEMWGIDNDFLKADPGIVPGPPKIPRLTYSEASELAYFDHYSFHPRTVEPLESKHIPIHVLNTGSDLGRLETTINTETFVDEAIVKSVACSDDISLLKLDGPGVGLKPGILAKVTGCLNDAGINIKSVITSQISINLILEKKSGQEALKQIEKLGFTSVRNITVIDDVSLIGIIGHGMQQNYGVSARIFSAVAQNHINVLLSGSGASDLVSYLVVKNADKEKSVREIYKAFFG